MKIVISTCYGGFGLSKRAFFRLRELGHPMAIKEPILRSTYLSNIDRSDAMLLQVINEMGGEEGASPLAKLRIVEIPEKATDFRIMEYDGLEYVLAVVEGKIIEID